MKPNHNNIIQTFGQISVYVFTSFALMFFFTSPVFALTEYQTKQITDHLNNPKMSEDPSIFDGKQFVSGVSFQKVNAYYKAYLDKLKRATRGWNMLSSTDKDSPDAKALYTRLKKKIDWGEAMKAAYPAFKASQSGQAAPGQPVTPKAAQGGGMTGYQKGLVTRHLKKQDKTIFDGKNFVAGVPFPRIKNYYNSYIRGLRQAISSWNRQISSTSKATPDGQNLRNQLVSAKQWADAMTAQIGQLQNQYAQHQKSQKQAQQQTQQNLLAQKASHRQLCVEFNDRAMLPNNREPMERLIRQKMHGNQMIGSVELVKQHQQVAQQVLSVFDSIDYDALFSQQCWYTMNRAEFNPRNWYDAAKNANQLIAAAALNSAKRSVNIVGSATIQTPEQFLENDGWLSFEGPVTFKEKLYFGAHGREAQMKYIESLLAAAGVKNAEDALWGDQKKAVDTLRNEVEKTAGTWKTPQAKLKNYSSDLARRQVLKWHPNAKVHAAFISRNSYRIHKNTLGVILRRTMPGYVIFKVEEDPFCQLRSYTLTEHYTGGGKFSKAAGVGLGYVRFQRCP